MPTGLRAQVFPSNVAHLAGMPGGQVQDSIITKDGVEAGTINTHFAMGREITGFLKFAGKYRHFTKRPLPFNFF